MSKTVVEIASKHLGQTVSAYSDLYDKSLLVKVPRYMNREAYDIDGKDLPLWDTMSGIAMKYQQSQRVVDP